VAKPSAYHMLAALLLRRQAHTATVHRCRTSPVSKVSPLTPHEVRPDPEKP
jgi:hypothetical protein